MPATAGDKGLMRGFPPSNEQLVTKANWLMPPFNRYAFQHVREIFPTRSFSRGDSVRLPRRPNGSLASLRVKNLDGAFVPLNEFLESSYSDGFLVLHHGEIVYEQYWNGMTAATPHIVMSVTKSFTGTLVGIYADRGLIDYSRPIEHYIPELKESGFAAATIRQLMDMQAGLEWDETPAAMADPKSLFTRYTIASGFAPSAEIGSVYQFLPTMKREFEHGGHFRYVAPVTDVLGWLVERVSGKRFAQALDDEIMSKIGLEGEGYMVLDGWGKASSTGGLNLTARDLARFGLLIQNGGRWEGARILTGEFVRDTRTNGDREAFRLGEKKDGAWLLGGTYRNQWWVTPDSSRSVIAAGIYGQYLYVNPEAAVVIVRLGSTPGSKSDFSALFPPLFKAVSDELK